MDCISIDKCLVITSLEDIMYQTFVLIYNECLDIRKVKLYPIDHFLCIWRFEVRAKWNMYIYIYIFPINGRATNADWHRCVVLEFRHKLRHYLPLYNFLKWWTTLEKVSEGSKYNLLSNFHSSYSLRKPNNKKYTRVYM